MRWVFLLITSIQLINCKVILRPTVELDWWQNAIIYEIFPLSFKDSDGDGSGDFKGITQKLDYLVDIGVTAIWLTPFFESPLESGGYDITNYLDVQNVFGTIDDLKDLLNAAHSKNLKVIMDFVPNHSSDKHIWFKRSVNNETPYADYYIWKDAINQEEVIKNNNITPIVPNNWQMICDNASSWVWHNTRKQFYYTQFINNLPDLNYRNKNVHEEMKNILKYWIELGIDGIRIDALKHVYESESLEDEPKLNNSNPAVDFFNLHHIYTADQVEVYDLIKKWRLLLDEFKQKDHHTRIIMTESYSNHSVLYNYYTSGAEIPTNFNLMQDAVSNIPKDFERAIENWITKMPFGATFNSVLQNHDFTRFPTFYGTELIDGLNALSLFLPGVSIVMYGGEIGMENIPDKINFARGPMQWDDTKYAVFGGNLEQQEVDSSNDIPKWPTMTTYFEQLKPSDLNANKNNLIFKCILCGPKEKHISTSKLSNSNLRTHIRIKHPKDLTEFNNCMKKRPTDSSTIPHKQLKLSEVGKVQPKKKLDQAEFDKANLKLIIDTVSPFSFIEHPAFVKYCEVTSNKVPASRRNLMRDVEYLYNKMINEMVSELDTIKYVCITADCWSIFHKSYIGFTIHWINPQTLERCSKGLACRRMVGRHTYDNIAESIDKVLNEFKIQNKTTLIVTDNAANFVKSFRVYSNDNDVDLNECIDTNIAEENEVSIEITNTLDGEPSNIDNIISISLPPHQRCAAHTMNLIASVDIKDAEKDLTYRNISQKVFKKCQSIFNKQNQSTLSADIIKNHLGRYLITPNATRWNSYYDAMTCIVQNIDKMENVCNDLQLPTISGPREVSFLQEYCNVMKPISRALDIIQGDKNVSLGYLLPTINAVHKSLNDMKNIVFCRPLVVALKRGLNKRFARYMESKTCQVASCMVPKFKLNWAVEDDRNNIKNTLMETILDNALTNSQENLQLTSNPTSIEHHNCDIEDDFFNFEENIVSDSNNDFKLLVDNYLSNKNIKSPLDLPNPLKEVYIKYNTAVPSSAHVERLFSAGGQLLNKRRGSMADQNFEMTLLLKFNKYFE